MNRLKAVAEEPEERARAPDYWLVRTEYACFFVSAETARTVLATLRRLWRPRWVRFRDLSGSHIELPSRTVMCVGESTSAQRAFDRKLYKALDEEAKGEEERPWG